MITWLRTLALLRHPEVRRALGELRFREIEHARIRGRWPESRVARTVEWIGYADERLELGPGSSVGHGSVVAFGDERNGYGRIVIGERSWVGQYNNLRASEGADIVVGSGCLVSQFCTLIGANHGVSPDAGIMDQPLRGDRRGVVLRDDVWLGAGVVISPGVTVGEGAVIGANAVVTRDVPPGEIWAGVPARRIGHR